MRAFEKQGRHRRLRELIGQIGGWVLCAGSLAAGVWLIANDKSVGSIEAVSFNTLSGGGLLLLTLIVIGIWMFKSR